MALSESNTCFCSNICRDGNIIKALWNLDLQLVLIYANFLVEALSSKVMFKCHNIFVVKSRSGWTECTLPETDFTMYVF